MQNSIIKEFKDNPNVVVFNYNEGGRQSETLDWTMTVWDNYYLRHAFLFDETGAVSRQYYGQPSTGLPFGRNFIIDPDGRIVKASFGYDPDGVIQTIYDLLEEMETGVDVGGSESPSGFALAQNWPNPFNAATLITYQLDHADDISLSVYDTAGRFVKALVHQRQEPGRHTVKWDGTDEHGARAATGIYHARLRAGDAVASRKMMLLR